MNKTKKRAAPALGLKSTVSAATQRQRQLMAQWWEWIEAQRRRGGPIGELARHFSKDQASNQRIPRTLATIKQRFFGDDRDDLYSALEKAESEFSQYRWWKWLEQRREQRPADEVSDLAYDLYFRGWRRSRPLLDDDLYADLRCYLEVCGMSIPWILRSQQALKRAWGEFCKTGNLR